VRRRLSSVVESAAIPEAPTTASSAPSRAASFASSAAVVGLPVRLLKKPPSPAWIAVVEKPCPRRAI
jgi:hypothetical protein